MMGDFEQGKGECRKCIFSGNHTVHSFCSIFSLDVVRVGKKSEILDLVCVETGVDYLIVGMRREGMDTRNRRGEREKKGKFPSTRGLKFWW